jgi:hypothetical protein
VHYPPGRLSALVVLTAIALHHEWSALAISPLKPELPHGGTARAAPSLASAGTAIVDARTAASLRAPTPSAHRILVMASFALNHTGMRRARHESHFVSFLVSRRCRVTVCCSLRLVADEKSDDPDDQSDERDKKR